MLAVLASRSLCLVLSFSLAASPPSSEPADLDATLATAQAAFEAGDYEVAVDAFLRAYDLSPDPNFLYNVGRVYEESANLEGAIEYYGRFAREPGVSLDLRQQALERRKVLKEILSETTEQDSEPEVEPSPTPPPPVVVAAEPITADARPRADPRKGRGLRIAGVTALGVGGAALVAGGIFGGLARRDAVDLDETDDPASRQRLSSDGTSRAIAADVLFAAGGLLAVTGTALLISGLLRPNRAARRTAFAPAVGPTSGATMIVRF